MANKSSLDGLKNRYVIGGETEALEKRLGWWERKVLEKDDVTDISITIDSKYHKRPDLIAYDYYGNPTLAWIVLQYNNIVDIETELVAGKTIVIPSNDRVYFNVMIS